MSVQITVRIPDRLAEFVDDAVARGEAASRAEVVSRALLLAWRRQRDEADLAVLEAFGGDPYPELAGVHGTTSEIGDLSELD
jgi:Arc/MetJ-type ribon-helix-helix transcriptional regulator